MINNSNHAESVDNNSANGFHSNSPYCSKRTVLKKRKLCHNCHKMAATLVECDSMMGESYHFCSQPCAQSYKNEIIMRETMACLQKSNAPNLDLSPNSKEPQKPQAQGRPRKTEPLSNKAPELIVAARCKTRMLKKQTLQRKRLQRYRPHPSSRLNKRYWDRQRSAVFRADNPQGDGDNSTNETSNLTLNRSNELPIHSGSRPELKKSPAAPQPNVYPSQIPTNHADQHQSFMQMPPLHTRPEPIMVNSPQPIFVAVPIIVPILVESSFIERMAAKYGNMNTDLDLD